MAFDAFCCGIACSEVRNAVPEGRPKAIVRNEWHVGLLLGLRSLLPIDRRQLTALTKTNVSGERPGFRPFFWPMAYGSCERPRFRPFFWPHLRAGRQTRRQEDRQAAPKVMIHSWLSGDACCIWQQASPCIMLIINRLTDKPDAPGLQAIRLKY